MLVRQLFRNGPAVTFGGLGCHAKDQGHRDTSGVERRHGGSNHPFRDRLPRQANKDEAIAVDQAISGPVQRLRIESDQHSLWQLVTTRLRFLRQVATSRIYFHPSSL